MTEKFWNERYAVKNYVYGTSPNLFFKDQIDKLSPGRLLTLAEGEGRNGVYAARKGWEVTAVDYSEEGSKKALQLAHRYKTDLIYHLMSVEDYTYPENFFDAISLIYAHFPADTRTDIHKKAMKSLRKGGSLIMEAFTQNQINRNTGGPRDIRLLYNLDELVHDFAEWQITYSGEMTIHIDEGEFHRGDADILRMIVTKQG